MDPNIPGDQRMNHETTLNEHAQILASQCPDLARAYSVSGPLNSRKKPKGFETLWHTIVGQVISIQAAKTIWARLDGRGLITPQGIAGASDEALRECGLSRPKIKTIRAVLDAQVDFTALSSKTDQEIEAALTQIWGIGTWSARIYLIFALDRPDIMAGNDLALQAAVEHLLSLNQRPTAAQLEGIAERWRPYRSVAAQMLWAYYAKIS